MSLVRITSKDGYKIEDRGYSSPCWIWTGCISQFGYGQYFPTRRKSISAHRYYFIRYKGPIPEGLQIDHLCGVKSCVNPDHLEAVTGSVNQRRARKARKLRMQLTQEKEI